MKRQTVFMLAIAVCFAVVPIAVKPAFGGTIEPGYYYTWGINNDDLAIPDGSIITEAVLTIHGITNLADNASDTLYIHLLNNPPLGFLAGTDDGSGDHFANEGPRLTPGYQDNDLVYKFSTFNDVDSPLWNIFDYPLEFGPDSSLTIDASFLLELIDYAGTGRSFGFGLGLDGANAFDFDSITLNLTIESFAGPASQSSLTFTSTGQVGLVGYWKFDDDAANTTVIDSSGNGNDGTAQHNTSTLHATDMLDGALAFDGIGDYIQIADSAPLSPTQEVTVCGWFYFDDTSENVGLIWKHNYNYALSTVFDTVRFSAWNPLSQESRASFSTSLLGSNWNFIAGVFDGTNSRLYLNGVQVGNIGTVITGGIRDREGDLYIGQRPDGVGEQYFDGQIDDIRIFNTTLSETQIQEIYREVSGDLVGHWAMDDSADNTTVLDGGGYSNNGTAQQNTSVMSTAGTIDGALTFNGIGDYVQIADSGALSPTEEITVCGWFSFDDASENVGLIWKHSYNYALSTVSGTVRLSVWNPSSQESRASFSTSLLGSGWNFIAGVFDGTNSRLYLNGAPIGDIGASITGGIRDRAGDLYIGQRPDGVGNQYFDGLIDEVKIYGKALSTSEIIDLYDEGGI